MSTTAQHLRTPTGPRLGLAHLIRLRHHPVAHAMWLRQTYGDVYTMSVFGTKLYVTSGPDVAEQVLLNRDKVFANGPAWSHFIGPFFHRGLMLLDFDEHLHHRRIMMHAFSQTAMARYHASLAPQIREQLATWGDVESPKLHRMFKELTLDLALETFVGVDLPPEEKRRINKAFIAAVRAGTSVVRADLPGGIGPWSKGLQARATLEEFFRSELPRKRAEGGDDLFAQLCVAVSEDGERFSDDDIVNHMIFLLMAAHDTTTITMTSMAHYLARYPEWQDRVRAQSMAAGDISFDGLAQLTDLDLVMKEAMRLCAPVPSLPRHALRDTEIAGFRVPAGATVVVSPFNNHFLEEWWDNPTEFDPERFSPERAEDKVHRLAFQPFGGGVHKCIGQHFAAMQVKSIFHELVRNYRWSVPEGYVMPLDMAALPVPKDRLPVTLERL